ncbi:Thoeris anti-defense Tad2 family protein [Oceaniglobus trochenteri]|uniref:Thoeris anti-defense Tad2 family protein n=1 Tax=Oceaniglobus trochenteri TaxID=2763260 RepID=UPI001CFF6BB2|nr:MW1434 family type I TA system toxin [Oceaniglobus trochenteri]
MTKATKDDKTTESKSPASDDQKPADAGSAAKAAEAPEATKGSTEAQQAPASGKPGAQAATTGKPDQASTSKSPDTPETPDGQVKPTGPLENLAEAMIENAPRPFPLEELKRGARARRASWAPGYVIVLGTKGNRGKVTPCFMQSGSRSGMIEWKPTGLSDLLAEDWETIGEGQPDE